MKPTKFTFYKELCRHCSCGNLEKVKALTPKKINKNDIMHFKSKNHANPFISLSIYGSLPILKYFVKSLDFTADEIINPDANPIDYACFYNNINIIKYFFEKMGVTINQCPCALGWVFRRGHLNLARYFFEILNCNIKHINTWDGTALEIASAQGHLNIMKYIINRFKMNITDIRIKNNYILKTACKNRRDKIILYLFSGDIGLDIIDAYEAQCDDYVLHVLSLKL